MSVYLGRVQGKSWGLGERWFGVVSFAIDAQTGHIRCLEWRYMRCIEGECEVEGDLHQVVQEGKETRTRRWHSVLTLTYLAPEGVWSCLQRLSRLKFEIWPQARVEARVEVRVELGGCVGRGRNEIQLLSSGAAFSCAWWVHSRSFLNCPLER